MTAVVGAAAMAMSLAACGSGSGSSASSKSTGSTGDTDSVKTVAIHIPTVYDLPDAQEVEDEINKITEDKYKIHMDLNFISTGNWQQQSNLLLTGDETDVIAVFGTPLTTYVKNGQLADLTAYYENSSDEFKAVWSEDAMKGTTVK